MLQELNKEILINLNSLLDYNYVKNFVLVFADTPIFFLPIFLLWMWIFYSHNKKNIDENIKEKNNLLYIFYWVIIWIIINLIIQNIIHIERPEEAIKWVWKLLLEHIPDASFPSDHATVSIAFLSWLFFAWYKKTWFIFTIFVISMLISRIILWVHWPFDIIVWTLIWIISSLIAFKYLSKLKIIDKTNLIIIKMMKYLKL